MKPTIEQVKEVRLRTGLGLNEVVNAFKQSKSIDETYATLKARGVEIAEGKQKRDAGVSRLHSYVHNGKLGALVEFRCETDFVAKSDVFKTFMQDICMHVAANPLPYDLQIGLGVGSYDKFQLQPFVKDITKTVADVIADISAITGEKIEIGCIQRLVAI
jgi:translation elongation factor EF-Ts